MIVDLPALALARLRAEDGVRRRFRHIGGAADLAAAQTALKSRPAVFVLPLAERAGSPLLAGEFRQRKILQIGIVIADADASDSAGAAVQSGIVAARAVIERALIGENGWRPEGCDDALAWSGGRLARLANNGVLWWQDDYVTSQLVRVPV
ncbi:MAG: hypothetical protein LBF61_02760 [Azoarcus sp.]|jgi:hypothetical protein|nr:hypothetical protein [Azoarcus sp.]